MATTKNYLIYRLKNTELNHPHLKAELIEKDGRFSIKLTQKDDAELYEESATTKTLNDCDIWLSGFRQSEFMRKGLKLKRGEWFNPDTVGQESEESNVIQS